VYPCWCVCAKAGGGGGGERERERERELFYDLVELYDYYFLFYALFSVLKFHSIHE
jgi:hypothetical protein